MERNEGKRSRLGRGIVETIFLFQFKNDGSTFWKAKIESPPIFSCLGVIGSPRNLGCFNKTFSLLKHDFGLRKYEKIGSGVGYV